MLRTVSTPWMTLSARMRSLRLAFGPARWPCISPSAGITYLPAPLTICAPAGGLTRARSAPMLDDAAVADDEGLSLEHPFPIHRNDVDADQRQDRRLPAHGKAEGHDRRDASRRSQSAVGFACAERKPNA